jgi:hypothetical protein
MPEESLQSKQNSETPSSVPWYESNLLWGGIGTVLTVVGAMKHNLLWLLWFAWLCFLFTIWNATRGMKSFRGYVCLAGFILVSGGMLGLKIWLSPQIAPAAVNTNRSATQQNPPSTTTTQSAPPEPPPKQHKQESATAIPPPAPTSHPAVTPVQTPPSQPTYQQNCTGSACAQGPGSQATYNQYAAPQPLPKVTFTQEPLPAKPDASLIERTLKHGIQHPGTRVAISLSATFYYPAFLFTCSGPCIYSDKIIPGMSDGGHGTYNLAAHQIEYDFGEPQRIEAGTYLTFDLRSIDDSPITVIDVQPVMKN